MLQVTKEEPEFFISKKKTISSVNQSSSWEEISDIRRDLRKHILENEQDSLCVYCEKKIIADSKKSHIDHFRTRNLFPNLTLEYSNLLVSCNNPEHCAKYKDKKGLTQKQFDELLHPTQNIEDVLEHTYIGEIDSKESKGKFTIEALNLNYKSLIEERKAIISNISAYIDFDMETLCDCLGGHKNLIKFLIKEKEIIQ
jgi:uncharacterized protein (TIGR02646 family)